MINIIEHDTKIIFRVTGLVWFSYCNIRTLGYRKECANNKYERFENLLSRSSDLYPAGETPGFDTSQNVRRFEDPDIFKVSRGPIIEHNSIR